MKKKYPDAPGKRVAFNPIYMPLPDLDLTGKTKYLLGWCVYAWY